MLLVLTVIACGGDLSNQVFTEDADFIAALPGAEQLAIAYPQPDAGPVDEPSDIYVLNVEAVTSGQQLLDAVTSVTDEVVLLPPSERGDDYRVWGPTPFDGDPNLFVRVEMSRAATGATYGYAFQLGETSTGPWWEYVSGTHVAGETEVAVGSGSITVESAWGTAVVDYDLRAGREIDLSASQDGEEVVQWSWVEDDDGGATLDYAQAGDLVGDLLGEEDEELSATSAWLASGAGRGVARLTGGDLGGSSVELVQCWDEQGAITWSWDSMGWTEELGAESDCPFSAE